MSRESRLATEQRTVRVMIEMYCRAHHRFDGGMCDECEELDRYAAGRIDRCPFQEAKPVCARCRVHCYRREQRERIREVMRFSGPRMLLHHPWLALLHGLAGLRRPAEGAARG